MRFLSNPDLSRRFLGSLILSLVVLIVLTCDMEATGHRNRQQQQVVRAPVVQRIRHRNFQQQNFHHHHQQQNFQQQGFYYRQNFRQQNVHHEQAFLRRDFVGNRLNTFTSYNLAVPATVQYSYYQAPLVQHFVQPACQEPLQQQLYLQQQTGCPCDTGPVATDAAYLQTGQVRGAAVTRGAAYVTLPTAFITGRRVLLSNCH